MLIDRIDYVMSHSASGSSAWHDPDLSPSDAIRRNFWFCAIDPGSTIALRDHIGIDHIMVESDYPHADSTWPDTQATQRAALSRPHRGRDPQDHLGERVAAVPPPGAGGAAGPLGSAEVGSVIYSMHVSLDGYVEDRDGRIDFAEPDDDVHRAANEAARAAGAFVYGRRLYDAMEEFWTDPARADGAEVEAEFARAYSATPRVVVSDSLTDVPDGVRLVRRAEARAEVARLQAEVDGDIDLAGPTLAGSLLDLVDEFRPVVFPVVVGGGKPFWPAGVEPSPCA